MFCGYCGATLPENSNFCPVCGKDLSSTKSETKQSNVEQDADIINEEAKSEINTDLKNKTAKKPSSKIHSIISVVLVITILISGGYVIKSALTKDGKDAFIDDVLPKSIEGKYTSLRGNWVFELEKEDKNSGTFELTTTDGEIIEENKRKTWTKDDDKLTLFLGDREFYFLIVDGGIIELEDEDEDPDYYDYLAPKGSEFDYEIGNFEFHKDRTFSLGSRNGLYKGTYYVKNDIIYCKRETIEIGGVEIDVADSLGVMGAIGEYNSYTSKHSDIDWGNMDLAAEPEFWIYDGDRIADAADVYLKD